MGSEYIRYTTDETKEGQTHLLSAEMELLTALKHLRNYKKIREEENVLKISVKAKLGEIQETLKILDKLLPHASFMKEKEDPLLHSIKEHEDKKENSLEQELESIRQKLARLST